jgi:hypothetical protein
VQVVGETGRAQGVLSITSPHMPSLMAKVHTAISHANASIRTRAFRILCKYFIVDI